MLFKKNNKGVLQFWEARADGNTVVSTWGELNTDNPQESIQVVEGKNKGRANETSAYEQAELLVEQLIKKKLKSGYVRTKEEALNGEEDEAIAGGIKPMLAENSKDYGIPVPCYIQPKLDGHRCIAIVDRNGQVTLWSRKREPITSQPHIVKELQEFAKEFGLTDIAFDGELYKHGVKFQELAKYIRPQNPRPGVEDVVQYHIYDVAVNTPFKQRLEQWVSKVNEWRCTYIKPVSTEYVESEERIHSRFRHYRDLGYEGIMLRPGDGCYENKRSKTLLKLKEFEDAEFDIVGVGSGSGAESDCIMFTCCLPEDKTKTFNVRPRGSHDERRKMFKHKDSFIGKQLTVVFQGYTDDGYPRFPVGKAVRED